MPVEMVLKLKTKRTKDAAMTGKDDPWRLLSRVLKMKKSKSRSNETRMAVVEVALFRLGDVGSTAVVDGVRYWDG